jgi:hypothetical protein
MYFHAPEKLLFVINAAFLELTPEFNTYFVWQLRLKPDPLRIRNKPFECDLMFTS